MKATPYWSREHSGARSFLLSGAAWMAVGTSLGFFTALHLVAPEMLADIPWASFGRMRPAHTSTVLFGFVMMTLLGCLLFIVPKMLKTKLFSEPLANLSCLLLDGAILWGGAALLAGRTQGREYAEYVFSCDVLIVLAFALLCVNLAMTIARRREPLLYVSVWYAMGGVLWTTVLYPVGNVMWNPPGGAERGIIDAVFLWFYGHNVFGLLVTPFAVAVVYYVLPRVARAPLYSHGLSLVGFWSLLALYTHIGGHHLLQAPVPMWLKVVSVTDSFAMMIPVAAVLVNFWYTARGRFDAFLVDPAAKLVLIGSVWYAFVCLQGPLQSLPSVQRVTHFTNWVVGHAHIAVLGFTGFIALGGMYYLLPAVTGRRLHSATLVNVQYWLVLIGLTGFLAVLTAAGLVQGHDWLNGGTVYRALPLVQPYMVLRLMFGLLIIAGAYVGLYNVVRSLSPARSARAEESPHETGAAAPSLEASAAEPQKEEEGAP